MMGCLCESFRNYEAACKREVLLVTVLLLTVETQGCGLGCQVTVSQ